MPVALRPCSRPNPKMPTNCSSSSPPLVSMSSVVPVTYWSRYPSEIASPTASRIFRSGVPTSSDKLGSVVLRLAIMSCTTRAGVLLMLVLLCLDAHGQLPYLLRARSESYRHVDGVVVDRGLDADDRHQHLIS